MYAGVGGFDMLEESRFPCVIKTDDEYVNIRLAEKQIIESKYKTEHISCAIQEQQPVEL